MNFLVLLLVGLILLWSPWRRGYPRDPLRGWVASAVTVGRGWLSVLAVLSLLLVAALVLWLARGQAYGFFTLLLHVALLLCCVGRQDPLRSMTAGFAAACQRHDQAAAVLLAEQQLGVVDDSSAGLMRQVSQRMAAVSLQDYFVPAFWYLLLGPLGALAYRLLELTRQQWKHSASEPAGILVHALEWIPARLLALSLALVGQFDDTLRALRGQVAVWEISGGELVGRCAAAALEKPAEDVSVALLEDTRQLMIRALLAWAAVIAFLSVLG